MNMKKKSMYAALIVFFIIAVSLVIARFRTEEKQRQAIVYGLLDRQGLLAKAPEWGNTKASASRLLSAIQSKPGDIKSKISLANLFILEARATGNYTYYDKAAMKLVDEVLSTDASNFEALTLKSLLYLSQHHFGDGLALAQKAEKINPYNAFLYGILVDGYVEMGNYDSALVSAERMMSIRPDMRSYARASYLREIYGDYEGAVEMMKLAVDAGAPGDEATEWSRVQLGHLYENMGDRDNAEMNYATALENRPGFVQAIAGKARLAMAAKDYAQAIVLYQAADSIGQDLAVREELVDAYQLGGQEARSVALAKQVIEQMSAMTKAAAADESIGHYADKELAYAYLRAGDLDKALEHATAEYNRRPLNIDVNEAMAWVHYKKGEPAKALPYIRAALSTNSRNPVLLCRAGLIYAGAGDRVKARQLLGMALKGKAIIPETLKKTSEHELSQI
jgi:tetratricopeptide (TPR) repeat protein